MSRAGVMGGHAVWRRLVAALLALPLIACTPAIHRAAPSEADCGSEPPLAYLCGASKPEDLAQIPRTEWIVASGFSIGAGLKLINARRRNLRVWFHARSEQVSPDRDRFGDCALPPDPALFTARGISFRELRAGQGELYVVNHGGRESVEVFAVNYPDAASEPRLRWLGCLALPPGHAANSVATYSDGTVLVTILTRPGTTITDFVLGQKTGIVMERAPGEARFRPLKGTELEGNNGLETSREDDGFFVVAFGTRRIVRYDRSDPSRPVWSATAPGFMPDNLHWYGDRLLAAGMVRDEPACGGVRQIIDGAADGMTCHRGYVAALLDPSTRSWSVAAYGEPSASFNGVSSALIVGEELWLGSYQADRVAVRSLPKASLKLKNELVR